MELADPSVLVDTLLGLSQGRRQMVALAGPPGAGKSTLAQAIAQRIEAVQPGRLALLQMDGFHYDDRVLDQRGLKARKGAPDTFDVGGLAALLDRLIARTEAEVAVPVFDRDLEVARAAAAMIPKQAEIILVEGNYLLLNEAPWGALHGRFDVTALIYVEAKELHRRLSGRWTGYNLGADEIAAKVDQNDLPNGLKVLEASATPDMWIDGAKRL